MSFEKYTEVTISLENSIIDKIEELAKKFNYNSEIELMEKMVAFDAGYIYGKVKNIVEYADYYLVSDEMEGACSWLIDVDDNYICEGDILKHDDVFGIVLFDKGAFMYHQLSTKRENDITLYEYLDKEYNYKNVGNIRKNPEIIYTSGNS